MTKFVRTAIALSLLSSPAFADVTPDDCRPVFPVMDQTAAAQDVVSQPQGPTVPAKRRFLGLPFLLLPLLAAGGAAALSSGGNSASPQ
jgi:hypothetical protein